MATVFPVSPSPEQEEVVRFRAGHLQVIACAGAGKTEAISQRVAALISEGVEPPAIVAFTFTDRAAESLKTRITRRVAEASGPDMLDRLGPMFVGTIHSYCLRLLQEHVPRYGNFDILDAHRQAGLLSREHKRLGLSSIGTQHWRPIFDFLRNADAVENELIPADALAGTPFGDCDVAYRRMLERYHLLTYGQLVTAAVDALHDPLVYARVHGKLRHLIVDEYQDINPAQERLISLLARAPVQLCVVGDDDQAIYQWRGSDVSNIIGFTKRYAGGSRSLAVNRRSRPGIIAAANEFAGTIAPRLEKAMETWRPPDGPELHAWAADTPEAEADAIAGTIERLVSAGYRYRDVGVLYRSVRTSADPLIAALRARDIPVRCAGRTGLFRQPEAAVLGRTYAWLSGNEWKTERFGTSQPVDLESLLDEYTAVFQLDTPRTEELRAYLTDWQGNVSSTAQPVNLLRDYYRLLRLLAVEHWDMDQETQSARLGTLARFSQILADYENVTRRARYVEEDEGPVFRGGQDRGVYFYRRLFNYLQFYALDAYEDFDGEDTFDLNAVNVLTVHQAKGLEWPVVFLPCLVEGRFPSGRAGEHQEWLIPDQVFGAAQRRRYEGGETEERRLFYVAMTRARDMLYLSRFRHMTRRFTPSRFLIDVAGMDAALAPELPLPPPYIPSGSDEDEVPTLSFSELAQYEGCPLRYRLSTSLGFQPQLAQELGYGRAIHHILRRFAEKTRATRRLPNADEVQRTFDEEFYLPFANRAAFEQLLGKAQRLVNRYLGEYSADLLRVWETERAFALHLEAGVVTGRADVILDEEGGARGALALVDYKTSTEGRADDVFAFQLAIYTAAGRGEGIDVRAAYLHDLSDASRRPMPVDEAATSSARQRATRLIASVVDGEFPPRPDRQACPQCDVRAICRHAACGKYDY